MCIETWATDGSWHGQAGHILSSTEHLHVAEAAAAPWLAGKELFQSSLTAGKVKCFIKTLLRMAGCFSTCLNNWWLPADGFALIWDSISTPHGYLWYFNRSPVGGSLTAHTWVCQQGEVPGWLLTATEQESLERVAVQRQWKPLQQSLDVPAPARSSSVLRLHANTDLWANVFTQRIYFPLFKAGLCYLPKH